MEASPKQAQEQRSGDASGPETVQVTVVVPCFNHAHFLKECLESVRAQSFGGWEVVVVDDGSADGADLERTLAKLEDARIRLVRHEENRGRAAARNTGIRASGTEYVLMLDADDRLAPGCLASLVDALRADEALDCAYPDVQLFSRAGHVVSYPGLPDEKPLLFLERATPVAGALMRRSFLERVGGFDEAEPLRGREDLEFWIRAVQAGCSTRRVEEPGYEQRVLHSSRDVRETDDAFAAYVYEKHRTAFDEAGIGPSFQCSWLGKAARASYLEGRRRRAFRLALRELRLAPSRRRLTTALRTLLPPSANRSIDVGGIRRVIPLVGYPLRGEARYRPFFVIGNGRSGNTLLRRVLTAHSKLHLPPEGFVIGRCIRKFRKLGRKLTWPDLVSMVLAEFQFHPEFYLFEMDLAPLAGRLATVPRRERNLARVLDGVFRYHAEVHGQSLERWGDKTPMNSLDDALTSGNVPRRIGEGVPQTLERLLATFPDAQFLHIYRDGCDVVHSMLRGGFFVTMESAARRWLHVALQSQRFARRHAERSFDVKYEDLVTHPAEVVGRICTFLEVDYEPSMVQSEADASKLGDIPEWFWHANVMKPITPASVGKARRLFTPSERRELQRLIGPGLAALGYPPATADPE